jgi:hypothetical protein
MQPHQPGLQFGEHHWSRGWFFRRLADGAVRMQHRVPCNDNPPCDDGEHILASFNIPAAEWASIVAYVSLGGETDGRHQVAEAFHASTGRQVLVAEPASKSEG